MIWLVVAAFAAPVDVTQQLRLLDPAGGPLEGAVDLDVTLQDGSGTTLGTWSSTPHAQDGYVTVVLDGLDPAWLQGEVWMITSVGGAVTGSAVEIGSVPRALRAERAGRQWLGDGNWGCNTSRVFVR